MYWQKDEQKLAILGTHYYFFPNFLRSLPTAKINYGHQRRNLRKNQFPIKPLLLTNSDDALILMKTSLGFFFLKKGIWIFADSMWFPLLFLFQKVICGLNNKIYEHTVEGKKDKETKVEQVAQYMEARIKGTRDHNSWARKFFFCECLNFFNVILQIILTDKFLGGEFSTYGTEVLINENFSVTNFLKNRPSWQHWHY